MSSLELDDVIVKDADVKHYFELTVREVDNPHFGPTSANGKLTMEPTRTTQMNGISNRLPPAPMLTQMKDLHEVGKRLV